VAGYVYDSTLSNNVAFEEMVMPDDLGSLDGVHGTNISKTNAVNQSSYDTSPLTWAFGENNANPWKWGASVNPGYPLPVLYWQTNTQILSLPKPTHLTTP